jgi:[FeFe] hydrogenase H-cluster maturation GTPase HydF
MKDTPLSETLQIVLLGMRNSGKSSLMNALFGKEVCIVSQTPGTTTDPVIKRMELLPLGPVAFTDTAGIDDIGSLGSLRVKKTREMLKKADIVVFTTPSDKEPSDEEKKMLDELQSVSLPFVFALTFADKVVNSIKREWIQNYPHVLINNLTGEGTNALKQQLIESAKNVSREITPLEGIVRKGELVLLVVPIDTAAPRGRLILPQVETIRDLLDRNCAALIVKERELKQFYQQLKTKPALVITDSQAFHKVAADLPPEQKLTSFSILFARKKGELKKFVEGIIGIKQTSPGSKILIIEACSHHKQPDDIGSIKIPRLFRQLVQPDVQFEFCKCFPDKEKIKDAFLAITCGGCMVTRREMLSGINLLESCGVKVTNYGLFLAWANGLLPRALEPFPLEYKIYKKREKI